MDICTSKYAENRHEIYTTNAKLRSGLPRFGLPRFCFLGPVLLNFRLGHCALLERRLDPAFVQIQKIHLHSNMQACDKYVMFDNVVQAIMLTQIRFYFTYWNASTKKTFV